MPKRVSPRRASTEIRSSPGFRRSARQHHLAAGNGDGLHDQPGGRLPQPIADLVVEGDGFLRRVDVDVIAQPVEELRAVGLGVDRIHGDALAEHPALRTVGLRVEIDTLIGLPDAGRAAAAGRDWPACPARPSCSVKTSSGTFSIGSPEQRSSKSSSVAQRLHRGDRFARIGGDLVPGFRADVLRSWRSRCRPPRRRRERAANPAYWPA